MEKYKNHFAITVLALLLINLMVTCNGNSKINATNKRIKELDTIVVRLEARPVPLTEDQLRDIVRDETMTTMYDYLIYETDLDKGKTSLSQIKSDVDRKNSTK